MLAENGDIRVMLAGMPDLIDAVEALCALCDLSASTRRIPTPDGGERWEIRAVSITGSESWRVEADEMFDAA